MQKRGIATFFGAVVFLLSGCGGQGGPELAPAEGVVTYQGRPIADALVTFIPDEGPVATGSTDLEGKFELHTGSRDGAVLGQHKVAISAKEAGDSMAAASNPQTPEEGKKAMMQMRQMGQGKGPKQPRSIIPEKYSSAQTSGLTAIVTNDPAKNQFKFEL